MKGQHHPRHPFSSITLFAPDDSAFKQLGRVTFNDLLNDKEKLTHLDSKQLRQGFIVPLHLKDFEMNVTWKRLLVIATFVSPAGALAAGAAEDKEKSNHGTNKKAIAMEAKEDKVRGPGVRDWVAIDTDKDHSISPEEMQKFLTHEWNAKGKS